MPKKKKYSHVLCFCLISFLVAFSYANNMQAYAEEGFSDGGPTLHGTSGIQYKLDNLIIDSDNPFSVHTVDEKQAGRLEMLLSIDDIRYHIDSARPVYESIHVYVDGKDTKYDVIDSTCESLRIAVEIPSGGSKVVSIRGSPTQSGYGIPEDVHDPLKFPKAFVTPTVTVDGKTFKLDVVTNAYRCDFTLFKDEKTLHVDIDGPENQRGYFQITIPHLFLAGPYTVYADKEFARVNYKTSPGLDSTTISFGYPYITKSIDIRGMEISQPFEGYIISHRIPGIQYKLDNLIIDSGNPHYFSVHTVDEKKAGRLEMIIPLYYFRYDSDSARPIYESIHVYVDRKDTKYDVIDSTCESLRIAVEIPSGGSKVVLIGGPPRPPEIVLDEIPSYDPLHFPKAFVTPTVTVDGKTFKLDVVTNAYRCDFTLFKDEKRLHVDIDGPENQTGYFEITIPYMLLTGPYNVTVDDEPITNYKTSPGFDSTTISFVYHTAKSINITGIEAMPLFNPLTLIIYAIAAVIAIAGIKYYRRSRTVKT